jgi:branched-chain amino acid transport system substrate-binding protein
VLGQKVELVTADHQNKPDLAVAISRRWYDSDGIDMITELTTSSVALALQQLSNEMKKIDLVVGAASLRITGLTGDTLGLAVGTGGGLVNAGGDKWFLLTTDYALASAPSPPVAARCSVWSASP